MMSNMDTTTFITFAVSLLLVWAFWNDLLDPNF
jgi:hypothetical protein